MNKQVWFSSDWHLGHKNILEYDKRPFVDIDEMNTTILDSYNRVVNDGDDFYFLGDFCLSSGNLTEYALNKMKGNKYFIIGNHDNKDTLRRYKRYGELLGYAYETRINDQKITLSHYSHRVWNGSARGSWMLYGHSHFNLEAEPWGKSMDVGIMTSYNLLGNWEPINFNVIKEILDKRSVKTIDHHKERQ